MCVLSEDALCESVCAGVVSETGENGEVQEVQESVCVEGEEDVTITLSETDTICLLDIPGSVVTDPSQQRAVQEGNQVYQEVNRW